MRRLALYVAMMTVALAIEGVLLYIGERLFGAGR